MWRSHAKKGSVSPWAVDEMLVLRWRYQGKRYSLAVGHSQEKPTKALAARIEMDMAAGHFDPTLESYRPKVDQTGVQAIRIDRFAVGCD